MKHLIIICLLLSACQTAAPKLNAPEEFSIFDKNLKSYRTGDALSQSVREIGDGFYVVTKSVVNPPEHWEGIGHFGYIYFGDTEICRCKFETVSLSSDKKFITYRKNRSGAYERLNLDTGERTFIEIGPSHE